LGLGWLYRLNRLGDEGCRSICEAAKSSRTLERLSMSANDFTPEAAAAVALLVASSTQLQQLDVSCNTFGPSGGADIRMAVQSNSTLQVRSWWAAKGLWPQQDGLGQAAPGRKLCSSARRAMSTCHS